MYIFDRMSIKNTDGDFMLEINPQTSWSKQYSVSVDNLIELLNQLVSNMK